MEKEEFVKYIVPLRDELKSKALSLTHDADMAEDLVQEVMLALWESRHSLAAHPNPRALALHILRNRYIDDVRRTRQQATMTQQLVDEQASASTSEGVASASGEVIEWIVNHLPPLQRSIFRLKELEGYDVSEIHRMTGHTPESIRKNLSRAKKRIRENYIKLTAVLLLVIASVTWALWPRAKGFAVIDGRRTNNPQKVETEALDALLTVSSTDEEAFSALTDAP